MTVGTTSVATTMDPNTLVRWTPVTRSLTVANAFLVVAVVALRGLLPALVLGTVGVVVGVAVRK